MHSYESIAVISSYFIPCDTSVFKYHCRKSPLYPPIRQFDRLIYYVNLAKNGYSYLIIYYCPP